MKILSADPGVTTGVVLYNNDYYSYWEIDCRSLQAWENFLIGANPDVIIYEDFKHRPGLMKAELYSLQVIAVIRLYAEKNNIQVTFTPLPTEAKKFWTNDKIQKLGLWNPGEGHAMDALRVLLKYRMNTDAAWFAEVLPKLKD